MNTGEGDCLATHFKGLHVRESSKKINPAKTYISELQRTKRYFVLSRPSFFAVADCHEDVKLNKKYCLLEKLFFTDDLGKDFLFTCSCALSTASRKRLTTMCKDLKHEPLSEFIKREKENVCIHLQNVDRLFLDSRESTVPEETENADDGIIVDQLSASPLLVAVYVEDEGYGIVHLENRTALKSKLACASCTTNIHFCEHVRSYKSWSKAHNIELDSELEYQRDASSDEASFQSISNQRIPYPLPENLREKFDNYESQKTAFPLCPNDKIKSMSPRERLGRARSC